MFENQFLQLSTRLPTPNVYGIGENIHQTFRRNLEYHTYPMFGRDQPTKTDDTLTVSLLSCLPMKSRKKMCLERACFLVNMKRIFLYSLITFCNKK